MKSIRSLISAFIVSIMLCTMMMPVTVEAADLPEATNYTSYYDFARSYVVMQQFLIMSSKEYSDIDDFCFTDVASADETVEFAWMNFNKEDYLYTGDVQYVYIAVPYDDMVEMISYYFTEIPSEAELKSVDLDDPIGISYNEELDAFVRGYGDGGDVMRSIVTITELVEAGVSNIYIKVSNETADMIDADTWHTDPEQFTCYVMQVEHTGTSHEGTLDNMKIVSFQQDTNFIEVNEETFPDDAFRAQLLELCDADGDGLIGQYEMPYALVVDEDVQSIEGVEYLTTLQLLDISNTGITSVDVSTLTNLLALNMPEGDAAVINIAVDTDDTATKAETTLSNNLISALASAEVESLVLTSGVAEFVIDELTLAAIADQTDSSVTLIMEEIGTSTLSDEAKELVGDRPVFEFTIVDENGNKITDFAGGKIKITAPYELQEGEVAENLVVYYIAEDGTLEKVTIVSYDEVAGTISFEVSHFSTYAIAYEASVVEEDDVQVPEVESSKTEDTSPETSSPEVDVTSPETSSPEVDITSPETGDSANTALLLCCGMISLFGMAVVLERKQMK